MVAVALEVSGLLVDVGGAGRRPVPPRTSRGFVLKSSFVGRGFRVRLGRAELPRAEGTFADGIVPGTRTGTWAEAEGAEVQSMSIQLKLRMERSAHRLRLDSVGEGNPI